MTDNKFRSVCTWVFIGVSINNFIGYMIGICQKETSVIYWYMGWQLVIGAEIVLFNILRSVKK